MSNNYHFIGIGGIGMSGLARIVLSRKNSVSGSDLASNEAIRGVIANGGVVHIGHSASYIEPGMTVVYNTDIKKDNLEYQAAIKLNCTMLHRSEMLQKLMEDKKALAVAGTHGKTTTSSLLTWVLKCANKDPSYAIGGIIPQLKSNAGHGEGEYFVAESCESDGTFRRYHPYGAIVTNVDLDHMDYYVTEEALEKAFIEFMSQITSPQHFFWCGDDHRLQRITKSLKFSGISYGFGEDCYLQISNFVQKGWFTSFDIKLNGKIYKNIIAALVGKHNALNSAAVFGLALTLGIEEGSIREALKTFGGVLRRCEKKGEIQGVLFLDDYGHHPVEIQTTLKAVRNAIGERRLIVVYQSHRYSRTKACVGCYGGVFQDADLVLINEVYGAGEAPIPGVSHAELLKEVQKDLLDNCQFTLRKETSKTLARLLKPHDVVLTIGAGDVTGIGSETIELLSANPIPKLKVGVIYGGVSVEHDISIASSKHITASLSPFYYQVEKFYISRQGGWEKEGITAQNKLSSEVMSELSSCDILFPVLHGTYGEDGTIQGLFELLAKPYVGCDYRSSAIAMDKVITKKIFLQEGIATPPFVSFTHHEWKNDKQGILTKILKNLCYPLFVKPSHLGSSIGVHKVRNEQELISGIEDAFQFDTWLLVENGIEGREIEFAVLGNDEIEVFPPGEIYTNGAVYDYESKYSPNGMKIEPRATLTAGLVEEGINLAKKAYQSLGCMGMARVDMFLDKNGKYWLNEINPIPGFTKSSLYPQICKANGLDSSALVDRLIILGLHRRRFLDRLTINPILC